MKKGLLVSNDLQISVTPFAPLSSQPQSFLCVGAVKVDTIDQQDVSRWVQILWPRRLFLKIPVMGSTLEHLFSGWVALEICKGVSLYLLTLYICGSVCVFSFPCPHGNSVDKDSPCHLSQSSVPYLDIPLATSQVDNSF